MQFAFTYFYFLMHDREEFTMESFFKTHLDIDGDGCVFCPGSVKQSLTRFFDVPYCCRELNDIELRLLARFLVKDVTPSYFATLKQRLQSAGGFTLAAMQSDEALVAEIRKQVPRPHKYRCDN